jgi:flagellar protein FlaI
MSQIVKSIEGRLAESLKDALAKNPHLARYLDNLAKRGQKLPDYVEQLSREMRYAREVNIIYPVGDPMFIHIKSKKPGERPLYIVIQPAVDERIYKIIDLVEEILISQIDENIEFNTPEEHEEALRNILKRIIKIDWGLKTGEFKIDKKSDSKKIYVNNETYRSLEYQLIMDKVYLGILEPFIRDEYIEDISCDGVGPIFVEHKIFGSCESNILFKNEYELDNFARRLSERTGRPATFRNPIVDASLPDGSRINIVFGKDLSMRGTNFTIRKFSDKPLSIVQIIKYGGISALGAAYLWILLENNMSIWF